MNTIITIGRQFGSGGHDIGKIISQKLGIDFYDKELLQIAAKESGMCEEIFENNDEKPTSSLLYNIVMDSHPFGFSGNTYVDMPLSHKVFLAQFDSIKKIADAKSAVIIGRCADYALSGYDNCLNIFIYADNDWKIMRIKEAFNLNDAQAKDMMLKKDKKRAAYYNYYSSKKWGKAETYDLCINSTILGLEGTADLIIDFVKGYNNKYEE